MILIISSPWYLLLKLEPIVFSIVVFCNVVFVFIQFVFLFVYYLFKINNFNFVFEIYYFFIELIFIFTFFMFNLLIRSCPCVGILNIFYNWDIQATFSSVFMSFLNNCRRCIISHVVFKFHNPTPGSSILLVYRVNFCNVILSCLRYRYIIVVGILLSTSTIIELISIHFKI